MKDCTHTTHSLPKLHCTWKCDTSSKRFLVTVLAHMRLFKLLQFKQSFCNKTQFIYLLHINKKKQYSKHKNSNIFIAINFKIFFVKIIKWIIFLILNKSIMLQHVVTMEAARGRCSFAPAVKLEEAGRKWRLFWSGCRNFKMELDVVGQVGLLFCWFILFLKLRS